MSDGRISKGVIVGAAWGIASEIALEKQEAAGIAGRGPEARYYSPNMLANFAVTVLVYLMPAAVIFPIEKLVLGTVVNAVFLTLGLVISESIQAIALDAHVGKGYTGATLFIVACMGLMVLFTHLMPFTWAISIVAVLTFLYKNVWPTIFWCFIA